MKIGSVMGNVLVSVLSIPSIFFFKIYTFLKFVNSLLDVSV